ncbi:MAG: hypothetical protein IIA48_06805 [Bacteroidetes bacterium]|nr:hypothetical protein [Bacteroidota bacterium]
MDTLTFISSLFSSLVWPIAILIVAFLFKKNFSSIIEGVKLKRIKRGDLELNFDQELSELKIKSKEFKLSEPVKENLIKLNKNNNLQLTADDQIELISQINPTSAIALSWSNIEKEILNTINRLAISSDYPLYNSSLKNIQILRLHKYIDKNEFEILNRLRLLRNEVVHKMYDSSIAIKEVEEFNNLSKVVLEKLKSITRS